MKNAMRIDRQSLAGGVWVIGQRYGKMQINYLFGMEIPGLLKAHRQGLMFQ